MVRGEVARVVLGENIFRRSIAKWKGFFASLGAQHSLTRRLLLIPTLIVGLSVSHPDVPVLLRKHSVCL